MDERQGPANHLCRLAKSAARSLQRPHTQAGAFWLTLGRRDHDTLAPPQWRHEKAPVQREEGQQEENKNKNRTKRNSSTGHYHYLPVGGVIGVVALLCGNFGALREGREVAQRGEKSLVALPS